MDCDTEKGIAMEDNKKDNENEELKPQTTLEKGEIDEAKDADGEKLIEKNDEEPKPKEFKGWLSFLNDGFGPKLQRVVMVVMVLNVLSGVQLTRLTFKFGLPYLIMASIILCLWIYFIKGFNYYNKNHSEPNGEKKDKKD